MNANRANAKLDNITGLSRKVYEATPASESWGVPKIIGEMARQGHQAGHTEVMGCLMSLVGQKLVREPVRGQFIREKIKQPEPRAVIAVQPVSAIINDDTKKEDKRSDLEKRCDWLMLFASAMRDSAERIHNEAKILETAAGELEKLALDAVDKEEKTSNELQQLRQLKSLLSSLNAQAP